MTRDELIAALNSIEWSDVEFKEATWEVPRNALSTVSAFANTQGGHLVFGVKETNGTFKVTGVVDADRLQNTFLGQVRDINKIISDCNANIRAQQLATDPEIGYLVMDIDQDVSMEVRKAIAALPTSIKTRILY